MQEQTLDEGPQTLEEPTGARGNVAHSEHFCLVSKRERQRTHVVRPEHVDVEVMSTATLRRVASFTLTDALIFTSAAGGSVHLIDWECVADLQRVWCLRSSSFRNCCLSVTRALSVADHLSVSQHKILEELLDCNERTTSTAV